MRLSIVWYIRNKLSNLVWHIFQAELFISAIEYFLNNKSRNLFETHIWNNFIQNTWAVRQLIREFWCVERSAKVPFENQAVHIECSEAVQILLHL